MNEVSDTLCFFPPPNTLSARPRGDLIRSNYFIDSFSGPYHCSFPSIKHMPGWIMWPDTMGCVLRQKNTRLHPCVVCLCHAPSTPFISSIKLCPRSSPSLYFKSHHIPYLVYHSISNSFLLLFLRLQAHRPSRPSGLSPGTSPCRWEPQLCWGVRCCGPQGLCSGWKMASSWDITEACQAFHDTAWLETPREVNRDTVYGLLGFDGLSQAK